MSATNRTLARLPPELFADLLLVHSKSLNKDEYDLIVSNNTIFANPEQLRTAVCGKLKSFRRQTPTGVVVDSVQTVGALLRLSLPTLLQALDPLLTYEECQELYRRVCVHCAPKAMDALALLHSTKDVSVLGPTDGIMRYLPSGLSTLDQHLRGGIRIGMLTELVGRAGVGKTQLAMQLCVEAARYGQGAVFIDTERKLSMDRLREIARQRASVFNDPIQSHHGGFSYDVEDNSQPMDAIDYTAGQHHHKVQYKSSEDVLANVSVHTPVSTEELLTLTSAIEEEVVLRNEEAKVGLRNKFPVRLLVLDSIAAPARRDFGSGSAPQRAAVICQIASTLKRLADQLQLAVIVINQAGGTARDSGNESVQQYSSNDTAALGTAWHHCVSTRVLMEVVKNDSQDVSDSRLDGTTGHNNVSTGTASTIRRRASIVKSNVAGYGVAAFEITKIGVAEPVVQQGQHVVAQGQ